MSGLRLIHHLITYVYVIRIFRLAYAEYLKKKFSFSYAKCP